MSTSTKPGTGKTEIKTLVATWAAFLASGAALTFLATVDLSGLPQWLQVAGGAALTAAVTWLSAFRAKHVPGRLSASALRAATLRR